MKNMKVYHNPRWGKSRKTLKILQDEGIDCEIIEYLKKPLNERQLKNLLGKLDLKPHDLIRKNNSLYKELKISSFTDDDNKDIRNNKLIQEKSLWKTKMKMSVVC